MLKEQFLGRCPSHFQINPIVKAFIVSEALIWSSWNLVTPIIAVFVVNNVSGGSIQTAAFGYSVYLISRVIFELFTGRMLVGTSDKKKYSFIIIGLFFLTLSYLFFAFTINLFLLFFAYFLMGVGLGVASPPKNSLFSIHLDKNKESTEWGVSDAVTFIFDSVAVIIGGFIATKFGFKPLFVIASVVSLLGVVPYILRFQRGFFMTKP